MLQAFRTPAGVLNAFGFAALVAASACLGASFTDLGEIGRAFVLGGFFCFVLVAIVTFGFAKVIGTLETLRADVALVRQEQAAARESYEAAVRAGATAPPPAEPSRGPLSRLFAARRR